MERPRTHRRRKSLYQRSINSDLDADSAPSSNQATSPRGSSSLLDDLQQVEKLLGGRVAQRWDIRVEAIRKLRAVAGYDTVRLGNDRAGDRREFLVTLKRLGPALCAQINDLRSVVVREVCACIGFLAATLGDVFAECVGDIIMPVLLKKSSMTISVISSSAMEAARKILSFSRNGISVWVVEQVAEVVKNKKEPAMRRTAAAEYIGLLLVDPEDSKTLSKTLRTIEEAIDSGCVDPSERVRGISRANWRKLEAAMPQRSAMFLDTLPPQVRARILQEKNYEMEAGSVPLVNSSHNVMMVQSTRVAQPQRVRLAAVSPDAPSTVSTTSSNEDVWRRKTMTDSWNSNSKTQEHGARRPRRSVAPIARSQSQDVCALNMPSRNTPARRKAGRARRMTLAPSALPGSDAKGKRPRRPPRRSVFPGSKILREINEAQVQNQRLDEEKDTSIMQTKDVTGTYLKDTKLPAEIAIDKEMQVPLQEAKNLSSFPERDAEPDIVAIDTVDTPAERASFNEDCAGISDYPLPRLNGFSETVVLSSMAHSNQDPTAWNCPAYIPALDTEEVRPLQPEDLASSAPLAQPAPEEDSASLTSIAEFMINMSVGAPDVVSKSSTIATDESTVTVQHATHEVEAPKGNEHDLLQRQPSKRTERTVADGADAQSDSEQMKNPHERSLALLRDALQRVERSRGWEEKMTSLKQVSTACKALSGCILEYPLARKCAKILADCIGESHFRVTAAGLDAVFDLFLNIEGGTNDEGVKINPLQSALEKHWVVLERILLRLSDTKEHIRCAAERVLHALAVQFEPEVRVQLILRAVNGGSKTTPRAFMTDPRQQKARPKLMIAALETMSAAFTNAKNVGNGFLWQQKTLEGLVEMLCPLLKNRRSELREVSARVLRQMCEFASERSIELAARNVPSTYRVALMSIIGKGRPETKRKTSVVPRSGGRPSIAGRKREQRSQTKALGALSTHDSESCLSSLSENST